MKKYLNKVKIVEPCDSIIAEITILTVALFWSASYVYNWLQSKIGISDIIESQDSTIFTLFKYFLMIPILPF